MSVKNNYPKDNSNGWYGACEVDFKELQEEIEKLKEVNEKHYDDIQELKDENGKLKYENEKLKEKINALK